MKLLWSGSEPQTVVTGQQPAFAAGNAQKSSDAGPNARTQSDASVSAVTTKKASELLGRSGLQLPRVPSLNTDRADSTEAAIRGYRLGYQQQQSLKPTPEDLKV